MHLYESFFPTTFQCTAYPAVRLENLTGYKVTGRISYAWCKSRDYDVQPAGVVLDTRGACLLKHITAFVLKDNKKIEARGYRSSGTAYSQFEIIKTASDDFCIQRVGTNQC